MYKYILNTNKEHVPSDLIQMHSYMDYATPVESCYSPEKYLNIGKTKFVLFEEDYEKISPYLFAFVW